MSAELTEIPPVRRVRAIWRESAVGQDNDSFLRKTAHSSAVSGRGNSASTR